MPQHSFHRLSRAHHSTVSKVTCREKSPQQQQYYARFSRGDPFNRASLKIRRKKTEKRRTSLPYQRRHRSGLHLCTHIQHFQVDQSASNKKEMVLHSPQFLSISLPSFFSVGIWSTSYEISAVSHPIPADGYVYSGDTFFHYPILLSCGRNKSSVMKKYWNIDLSIIVIEKKKKKLLTIWWGFWCEGRFI